MARDLVSGGIFFVGGAILAFTLSSALPLWWFTTTELEGEMCSCGTGLWTGNVTWGDDITQENVLGGPYRCNASNELMVAGCDAAYPLQTESRTKGYIAGVFSILATCFASMSCALGVLVLGQQDMSVAKLDVIRFRKGLSWAALMALVAVFCEITTIAVFMSSPLFDNLGDNFGCKFVFSHALNSNPLKCHALGPGFGLAVGGCLLCVFSCAMFYLAFRNPHYMDPETGRYSMFQEALLGARPLDKMLQDQVISAERDVDNGGEQEREAQALRNLAADSCEDEDGSGRRSKCGGSSSFSLFDTRRSGKVLSLYGIPCLLLLNAGLFTWSNCSTGATVEPHVVIKFPWELRWIGHKLFPGQVDDAGVVQIRDDVFNFTLMTSLRHFWEGKAYALALLIGAFSGCWPYIKLFTMMVLWFVPSTEKLRGKMLHWLEVLGKWSLIDAYVMCLMAVAFGFDTDKNILGIEVHVDIAVRPGWGVYSFVLATMSSLTLSHYMTYLHTNAMERRDISPAMRKAMSRPPHEALATRAYAPFPRRRRYACSLVGQAIMWLVLCVTLAVNLLGQLIGTFEFRFSGLADLILPPEKRITVYSLVSNGERLPEACSKGGFLSSGYGWAYFMTVMYFLFAMVIPLLMLVLLAVLWAVPMTLSTTKRVFHLCQVVQSWAALDVFLVSIIAAVTEIGGLSASVLGDAFGSQQDALCKVLKELPRPLLNAVLRAVGLPELHSELDECALFRVDAVLIEGTWMLLYSVAAWGICTHLIMEFSAASIEERTRIIRVLVRKEQGGSDSPVNPYELLRIVPDDDDDDDGPDGGRQQQAGQVYESTVPTDDDSTLGAALLENGDAATRRGTLGATEQFRSSVYLKRILAAQEEGARLFMGTYFGDCMYGPFPRVWYRWLARLGVLYKVDWNQVGFDVHALMLMNVLSMNTSRDVRATSHSGGARAEPALTEWAPTSPLRDND